MPEIWSSEESKLKVIVAGHVVPHEGQLTAEGLRKYARDAGISKFTVKLNGDPVGPDAFPISQGTVEIEEYNEAA